MPDDPQQSRAEVLKEKVSETDALTAAVNGKLSVADRAELEKDWEEIEKSANPEVIKRRAKDLVLRITEFDRKIRSRLTMQRELQMESPKGELLTPAEEVIEEGIIDTALCMEKLKSARALLVDQLDFLRVKTKLKGLEFPDIPKEHFKRNREYGPKASYLGRKAPGTLLDRTVDPALSNAAVASMLKREHIPVAAAAQLLECSIRTVYRRIKDRKLIKARKGHVTKASLLAHMRELGIEIPD